MTDPKKFFDDNISRLPRPISNGTAEQQREYNLNAGLRALTERFDALAEENRQLRQQIVQLQHVLVQTR